MIRVFVADGTANLGEQSVNLLATDDPDHRRFFDPFDEPPAFVDLKDQVHPYPLALSVLDRLSGFAGGNATLSATSANVKSVRDLP
jgi:hypothetical protein